MFSGFNQTVKGVSHQKKGIVCQDFSGYFESEIYGIAVVADGHGSKKHFRSDVGSKLAVKVVLNTISEFYKDIDEFETSFTENPKKVIRKIQKHIISHWNKEIFSYHEKNPVTEDEKSPFTEEQFNAIKTESIYGTTLIVAVMGKKFSFGIQIGDGSFVIVNKDAEVEMPIIDDESCPANLTASMCNRNAIDMFNSFYTFENPMAIFVSTDGLYTSFGSQEDFEDYHTIITGLLDDDMDNFNEIIIKNLTKRTHHGTQDDISLAGVFEKGNIKENLELIMEQIQRNKQLSEMRKAEHKAKIEKQKAKIAMMQERQNQEE